MRRLIETPCRSVMLVTVNCRAYLPTHRHRLVAEEGSWQPLSSFRISCCKVPTHKATRNLLQRVSRFFVAFSCRTQSKVGQGRKCGCTNCSARSLHPSRLKESLEQLLKTALSICPKRLPLNFPCQDRLLGSARSIKGSLEILASCAEVSGLFQRGGGSGGSDVRSGH